MMITGRVSDHWWYWLARISICFKCAILFAVRIYVVVLTISNPLLWNVMSTFLKLHEGKCCACIYINLMRLRPQVLWNYNFKFSLSRSAKCFIAFSFARALECFSSDAFQFRQAGHVSHLFIYPLTYIMLHIAIWVSGRPVRKNKGREMNSSMFRNVAKISGTRVL